MFGLNLHHIGVAVADIDPAREAYVRLYGWEIRTAVIHDPVQTARVQFLGFPGNPSFLELVAPDGPNSKLAVAMRNGGGLNHLCYATDRIEETFERLYDAGLFPISEPEVGAAFDGRRIAWLMGPDRIPIELVEPSATGEP